MRTLMVTPFAPYRDGIATYAVQELRRLRHSGHRRDRRASGIDLRSADEAARPAEQPTGPELVDPSIVAAIAATMSPGPGPDSSSGPSSGSPSSPSSGSAPGLQGRSDTVDVLSPLPSAARWHLQLGGPKGMLRLARKVSSYDRTIIQFGPEMLFGGCGSPARRVAVWTGLAAVAKRTSLDLRIHEIEYGPLEQNPLERKAARLALDQADRVTVHTEAERDRLDELLGLGRRIEIVDHGRDFVATVERTPAEARRELGLDLDRFLFVSIGFLQHHKGFD
ncbi:MAG: hypothetical protein ACR2QK_12020, partial [Acidimicrobiales bacterium]